MKQKVKKLLSMLSILCLTSTIGIHAQSVINNTSDKFVVGKLMDMDYNTINAIDAGSAGNIITIALSGGKDDANRLYTAFNLDIALPSGFEVVKDGTAYQIGLPDDFSLYASSPTKLTHSVVGNVLPGNILRVAGSSNTNAALKATSGDAFEFVVRITTPYIKPGVNKLSLTGQNLTTPDSKKYKPADCQLDINVGGTVSVPVSISAQQKYVAMFLPFDAEIPQGVKVYHCPKIVNGTAYLTPATTIEAYVPYVFYAENGYTGILSGELSADKYNARVDANGTVSAGCLSGTVTSKSISNGYIQTNGNNFQKVTSSTTVKEGQCWLSVSESASQIPAVAPKFKVTYMSDGSIYKEESVAYGEPITLPEGPQKEGHTFVSWGTTDAIMPDRDVQYSAVFKPNKYLVTFKYGETVVKSDSLDYGTPIQKPEGPAKTGYTFAGWGDVPATVPASDVIYTAQYTINKYNIIYMVDGKEFKKVEQEFASSITAIDAPTKTGHTFSGWSTIPQTMPAEDVTITGTFTVNQYKVIFKVDGEDYRVFTQDYASTITTPTAPTKEGYTFSGWKNVATTVPANDVTYEATFTVNQYTVKFIADGKVVSEKKQDFGSAITAPEAPTKEGYTFSTWGSVASTVPANDVTYTAQYTVNQYTVKFMAEGKVVSEKKQDFGSAITAPEAPAKEGYTFSTWGSVASTVPANDVTYTAQYIVNQYTVKFIAEGKVVSEKQQDFGSAIIAPTAPSKNGYSFSTWGNVASTVPAQDVTYTAQYTVNQYTVKFIAEGKVVSETSQDFGSAITAPEAPEKEGYTFNTWGNVASTVPAQDVTYTAQYIVNQYTVKFVADGKVVSEKQQNYGSTITAPTAPDKEGYTFSTWGSVASTVPAQDVTYTAQYTINQYTLTFIVDDQPYKTSTLDFGATITLPDAPVKEGYEFLGWGEVAKTMPAHDLEYKAEFKQSALQGDVNLDGQINAADVVAVYNFITSGEASGVALERADVNNDAQVNAGDVVAIYVIITGGN